MKSKRNSGRRSGGDALSATSTTTASSGSVDGFALAFGLFLGLALVKFGNPVILEAKIPPPTSLTQLWAYPWPPSWSAWLLVPLVLAGGGVIIAKKPRWPASRWLWILPGLWFGWQLVSATRTVDGALTTITLGHFGGCLAGYLLGALLLGDRLKLNWLLIGVLGAFVFCLVRAIDQKLFEFPQGQQYLLESERNGWTNVPPDILLEWKQQRVVISTNGADVANPIILAKYAKGRVHGTLVYPNALAGIVLLLFPLSITLAFNGTRRFRALTRLGVITLTLFLGGGALFWTGSKSGWLIAMVMGVVCLFRLHWSTKAKWTLLVLVMAAGLTVFGIRFRNYFVAGATSVGARFDYWRAAAQNTLTHPAVGSGPGTFQRPYERLKQPESEMARLVHNDYLEQFSDSGIIGGLSYSGWIILLLVTLGRRVWKTGNPFGLSIFIGLLGWYMQGLSEFGLYIPALAWIAFALAGCLLGLTGNQVDKSKPAH